MANEIDITVRSTDATAAGFAKSTAGSEAAAKKFEADQTAMAKASDNFEKLFKANQQDGVKASQTLRDMVANTRDEVDRLRSTFAQTGSGSDFVGLKKAEADLATAESYLEDMVGKAKPQGKKTAENFGDGFGSGIPYIGGVIGFITTKLMWLVQQASKVGEDAGANLADGMASAAAEDIPQLFTPQGAIGAAVVSVVVGGLAAVIGGAVASALTLGVGLGFIGIGALVATKNTEIAAQFTALKSQIVSTMEDAAVPLIAPFERAASTIGGLFAKEGPELEKVFAAIAPSIDMIVGGLTSFLSDLIPKLVGVGQAFTAMFSDPGVQAQLHILGAAFLEMFDLITHHQQDVSDFFAILIGLVNLAVVAVDILIAAWDVLVGLWRQSPMGLVASGITGLVHALDGGSKSAKGLGDASADAADKTDNLAGAVERAGTSAGDHATDFAALSSMISATAQNADTLAGQMTDKLMHGLLGVDESTNDFNKSLITLGDTLVSNGGHLSEHVKQLKKTETGAQQNKDAILQVVEANLRVYDSQIAVGISAKDAAARYDENTRALEDQLKAAGYLPPQIQALIGEYKNVPDTVNTDIGMNGLTTAINNLNDLLRALNGLPPLASTTIQTPGLISATATTDAYYKRLEDLDGMVVTTTMDTVHINHFIDTGAANPAQDMHGHASGGIASGLSRLAEHGRELIGNLAPGTMVHSNPDTERILADSRGGGGAAKLELVVGAGSDSALGSLIQKMVRNGQIQLKVNGQPVTVS